MKARLIVFTLGIGVTLYAAFFAWNVAQTSYIPGAVQAAAEKGTRLPAYQILGVDLASARTAWLLWSACSVGAYWVLSRKERKQPVGILLYLGFAAPLVVTSILLILPLAT